MCPNIHYSTIYNSQDMEATKCPSTEEGIKKTRNIYTMKYYSAIKKNEIISFAATWLYLEIILLSEVNQTKTKHLYMESREKMIQMNLSTKQTYRFQKRTMITKGERWRGGIIRSLGLTQIYYYI